MTRGQHQRVVGLPAVPPHELFGDRRRVRGEVDAVQMIFGDAVARDDEQVAGSDRHLMVDRVCGIR